MTGFARWRQSPPVEMRGCALGLHSETSLLTPAIMNWVTLFLVPARPPGSWVINVRETGQGLQFEELIVTTPAQGEEGIFLYIEHSVVAYAHPVIFVVISEVMFNPLAGLPNKYPEK